MYYMYFGLYLVIMAFGSPKLFPVFGSGFVDLLQTMVSALFGLYFLYRLLTRYRGDRLASQDCVFLIVFSLVIIIICNFL